MAVETIEEAPPRIRVLPPELADQIAAGEVVERPASVVKELVENAVDAGARRVEIDVEGGGRRLVRVVDDGCGMTPEEARLALLRHATSKLRSLDDLFAIGTMGFRGEALPSIAAVSRFTLTTRVPGALAARRIEVEGGVAGEGREVGAAVGTQVEVRDLLWNVPARLKFLKADGTEAAHVTEAVTRLALAHPSVHFKLRHGGRVAIDLPPHASRLERVKAVLGRRLAGRIFEGKGSEHGVGVECYLLPPDEAQTTSRAVSLFVGRRFVRDRGMLHAVSMGYGELCPRGRYPMALVFLSPATGSVDVNVHPQKIEVRFAKPQEVFAAVRHTVARALADAPWLAEQPGAGPSPVSMYAVTSMAPPSSVASGLAAAQARATGWGGAGGWSGGARAGEPTLDWGSPEWARPVRAMDVRAAEETAGADRANAGEAGGADPGSAVDARAGVAGWERPAEPTGFFGSLTYLGQLDRTYLVCEGDGEMVLIDQHAAHERIAFQRLREAHATHGPRTQRLLFPRTLDLEPAQAAAAEENRAALASIGFDLEPFGGRTWALTAAPVDLREEEVEPTVGELLTDLADRDASRAVGERLDHMFATIACHSVVRAGDILSHDEARALLSTMDQVDYRAHCPHGRPVLLRISIPELARRFGR